MIRRAAAVPVVLTLLASLLGSLLASPLLAQDAKAGEPERELWASTHSGTFGGKELRYRAFAGETILRDEKGEPEAAIFSTSYLVDVGEGADHAARPVTFLWNGGPGSSSVWLHMGAFGPVRVNVPSDARDDGAPPYDVVPNPGAFLDVSDVVFIDPVGTGFSRPLGAHEREEFYGIEKDAKSVAKFIRAWIREYGRWKSPKFIGGESYGTTRSAAVIRELEGRFNDVSINGVILISAILDFTIEGFSPGSELGYIFHLPTQAATAHYHGLAGKGVPLEQFVARARDFAIERYAPALMLGNKLTGHRRAAIRGELETFTGLSRDFLESCDLRVKSSRFQKELLRARGLTVGRLDSRYTGVDRDAAGERPEIDPSFYGIDGAYASALNSWLREDLGVKFDRDYSIIGGLGGSWEWKVPGMERGYLNVAPWLTDAMRQNSGLHVFVAAGYYDFATPFFGAEHSLSRTGAVPERTHLAYYEAGHMMYVHHPSLEALQRDVREFIVATLAANLGGTRR